MTTIRHQGSMIRELKPIKMWKDLTPLPFPLNRPSPNSPRVLIIGGGVIGLVTAWLLLDQGKQVTILSKQWATQVGERITSQIAGAVWEYPPAICGHQYQRTPRMTDSQRWSLVSYHCWCAIADDPEWAKLVGVKMRVVNNFFDEVLDDDPVQYEKMEQLAAGVRGFRRSKELMKETGVSKDYPVEMLDAYEFLGPAIDTDRAILWLMDLVQHKGARFVTETITGDLIHSEKELLQRFGADAIVNATGLGAQETAGDESTWPVRGALLRTVNDGIAMPKIESAYVLRGDSETMVFVLPRNDNILLIGGLADENETDKNLNVDSPPVVKMRERVVSFLPILKNAQLHPTYPIAIGLRPFREVDVRCDREHRLPGSRIIHSYGHGGGGWTLSFGCAADCNKMINEMLKSEKKTVKSLL